MSDDDASDGAWLEDDNEEEEIGGREKETMVLNPTSVRERIDSTLEMLRQALYLRLRAVTHSLLQ